MSKTLLRPHLRTAKDPRAVRTREALREALLKILDQKPFDQVTILDICEVAKVSYTTFFRHHPTKESLLNAVAAEQMERLVALSQPVKEASDIWPGVMTLCTYVHEHRHLWTSLLTGGAAGTMRDEFMRLSRQIAKTEAPPDAWPPPEVAARVVVSATIELLTWWLQEKKPLSIRQVAEILADTIVTPALHGKRRTALPAVARAKQVS